MAEHKRANAPTRPIMSTWLVTTGLTMGLVGILAVVFFAATSPSPSQDAGSIFGVAADQTETPTAPTTDAATDAGTDAPVDADLATAEGTATVPAKQRRTVKPAEVEPVTKIRKLTLEQRQRADRQLARAVERAARDLNRPDPAVFRVATFNVLGDSHTGRGGKKARFASGPARMRISVDLLNQEGVDVAGLQELEMVQHNTFMNLTGGTWGTYPGMSMGKGPVRNSITWRKDTWTLIDAGTMPIPYFRGARVPMPWVTLQHNTTGQLVDFINIHNPVSNKRRGNNERWRDLATQMEIDKVNELKADGTPVLLLGDFNERDEAYCKVTAGAGMIAAAPGGSVSPCRVPRYTAIDWIFGTNDLVFSNYERRKDAAVRRAADHPLYVATVSTP